MQRIELVRLRKQSCNKCWLCKMFDEFFEPDFDCDIIGINGVKDKHLYRVEMCNTWVDHESGHTDQWDWELVDVMEDETK